MKTIVILICLVAGLLPSTVMAQQPSPALTLQRVIEMYLQNNLELQAARYQVDRIRAEQVAARLRPNPAITVAAENVSVSGPTSFARLYEVAATYSQTIELGGKREWREEAAEQTVSAAGARYEDTLRRGLAQTKRLYYAALLARYNLEIANEDRQTFQQLVQLNSTRFQEGAIAEVDLIKVRLERVKFDSTVRQAELIFRQAAIALAEKLGGITFPIPQVEGVLAPKTVSIDRSKLREVALIERADVRAAAQEVAAASARLGLEIARAKPDITPFAGYKRIGKDNTVLAGVTMPLKVRDRNQAGIARAEAEASAAKAQLQHLKNRALAEVEAAIEALQTAQEAALVFQDELLGQADESRTVTLAAYEEGATDLLPVLEAQRTRTEVRQRYFKTLFDFQAGMADLELAVGKDIQQ